MVRVWQGATPDGHSLVVERDDRGPWVVTAAAVSRSRNASLEAALLEAGGHAVPRAWAARLAATVMAREAQRLSERTTHISARRRRGLGQMSRRLRIAGLIALLALGAAWLPAAAAPAPAGAKVVIVGGTPAQRHLARLTALRVGGVAISRITFRSPTRILRNMHVTESSSRSSHGARTPCAPNGSSSSTLAPISV